AFADEHGVDVAHRFVLHERRVDAAHDDWYAARSKLLRDAVRARRLRRERRQADQIRLDVGVIERALALLVDQLDLPVLGRSSGDVAKRQRLPQVVAIQRHAIPRIDQDEFHAAASMTARCWPTDSKIASARSRCSGVCAAETLARSRHASDRQPGGSTMFTYRPAASSPCQTSIVRSGAPI